MAASPDTSVSYGNHSYESKTSIAETNISVLIPDLHTMGSNEKKLRRDLNKRFH